MPKLFRQSSLSHGFYDQWALTILQEEMEATLLSWNWVIVDLAQYVMVFHDCYDIDDIFLDSFFVILLSVIFRYFFQLPDQIEYFKQWLCIRLVIKLRIPPDNRVKHPNNFLWLEIVAIIFIQNVFSKTIDYHVIWLKILVCFIQDCNRRRQLSWLPDSKDSPCEDIERILWAPISLLWISSSMKVYKAMSWRLVLLRKWKWIWVPINLWWIRGSMHSGLESESGHAVLL